MFVCTPALTLSFDFQGSSDQGEQGGVEGHCAITVQGHVHGNQPLQKRERQSKTQKMEENTLDVFCVCVCTLQATR